MATVERKVATLLFADLVGFTGLGERYDPEVVGALVGRVFDRLSDEVARYEGLVKKFAGDAMLCVFGVPQTHEDHAERAVRAALEMQSAMTELAVDAAPEASPGWLCGSGSRPARCSSTRHVRCAIATGS